jgi:hypothetical protein
VWQDGQVFKDLGARQLTVVEQRAQIEARRKQLKKKGPGNAHDNECQIAEMCLLFQKTKGFARARVICISFARVSFCSY